MLFESFTVAEGAGGTVAWVGAPPHAEEAIADFVAENVEWMAEEPKAKPH